jgi:hypothetical protein
MRLFAPSSVIQSDISSEPVRIRGDIAYASTTGLERA